MKNRPIRYLLACGLLACLPGLAGVAFAGTAPATAAKPTPKPVAPLRDPALTNRTTVDGRPLASSLPGTQQRTGPHVLANGELGQHVGDYIQVTTLYGDKREGRLVGVQGQSLNLRKSAGVGYAVQNIEFKQLREVMFLYR